MSFSKLLFAASVAAFHSFAIADEIITTPPAAPTLAARQVAGGPGTPILSTIAYAYPDLPHQVYPFAVLRGPQFGYNDCTKQGDGPDTLCQSLVFNSLGDFCLWGSPTTSPNGTIGDQEARVVAYCTQPGHGARVIPQGMLTGAQFIKTSAYIQITGKINNIGLNLDPGDQGGELDPHGADLQGNPLGGLVYSNGTIDAVGGQLTQAMNWNMFVGGNSFCMKICFNSITSPDYCENRYDLIGCQYNMPSNAPDGFTSCDGELQDVVGVYTGTDGKTTTWSMPDPLTPPPYTPRIPASSNCQTFASTDLYAAAPTATSGSSGTSTTGTGTAGNTAATGGAGSKTGSSTTGSKTGTQTGSPNSGFTLDVPFSALCAVIGFIIFGGRLL